MIHTNSPRVREARKINVELILSQHDGRCSSCVRGGNCALQAIANDLGILENLYPVQAPPERLDPFLPALPRGFEVH